MIISKFLQIFIFVHLINFGIIAQCGIGSPTAENVECITNASYSFDLNFTISDNSLDSFDIFNNEEFLHRYSVNQLPVNVTNDIYTGYAEDTFRLVDIRTDCYENLIVPNPCDCAVFDPIYSKIDCNEDSFYILLNFKHIKNTDSFDIGYNNRYLGAHLYENLPVKIGPLSNIDTSYSLFLADKEEIFCFTEFIINGGDCPQCEITNLALDSYTCDEDYNKNILFSFDHSNSGDKGYDVYVNDTKYATFDFNNNTVIDTSFIRDIFELNSIEIECEDTLHIKLVDVENPDCSFESEFTSFCCELCEVGLIDIRDKECTSDSTFNFILDFDYAKNRKDSFSLALDGSENKYSLTALPLHIKNYPIKDNISASVCLDGGKCCSDVEFEAPDCEYFDCSISGALYSITYDSISKYWVNINELVHESTSDSFTLAGNGMKYGIFSYTELPIQLGAYTCSDSTNLEYIFKDSKVDDCTYVIEPGIVNCPFKVNTKNINANESWNIYSDAKSLYLLSNKQVFNNASISIYNVLGKKVYIQNLENGKYSFKKDISTLNTGIYILYFRNNNYRITKKIYLGK